MAERLLKPHDGRLSPSPAPYLLLRRALRDVLCSPRHGEADSAPPSNTCVPGAGRRREGEGERVASSPPSRRVLEGQRRYRCPPGSGEKPSPRLGRGLHSRVRRAPYGQQEHPLNPPSLHATSPVERSGAVPGGESSNAVLALSWHCRGSRPRGKTQALLYWKPASQPERPKAARAPALPVPSEVLLLPPRPAVKCLMIGCKAVKVSGAVCTQSLKIPALSF